jgi:hypothetical protein
MFPSDDSDFELGVFPKDPWTPPRIMAKCRRCGELAMPDEVDEHRLYACYTDDNSDGRNSHVGPHCH